VITPSPFTFLAKPQAFPLFLVFFACKKHQKQGKKHKKNSKNKQAI